MKHRSLSASKFDTLRTCPRLYYFQHVLFLERAKAEGARRFGDLFHIGLEAWWKVAGQGDAPWAPPIDVALVEASRAMNLSAKHVQTDAYEVARAEAMLVGYHARWFELEYDLLEGQRGGVAVESWFSIDLRDVDGHVVPGWRINGKKDGIARFGNVPRVIEHKSTSAALDVASRYWEDVALAMQPSIYLDAASTYLSEPVDGVLWDVARKPDINGPQMATPEDQREYTKGKGCKECGGSAGGKRGIVKGSGIVMVPDPAAEPYDANGEGVVPQIEAPCADCNGTGWSEPPRLYAKQRDTDETVDEYRERVTAAIAANPEAHYQQVVVRRTEQQLAEARNDLVCAARDIGESFRVMEQLPNDRAHLAWGRNPKACLSQYGRRCDFIDVCPQGQDPRTSPLYTIRPKQGATP